MNNIHLDPLDPYLTFMSSAEEDARILQRINEEEARIIREWHQLSEAERRDESIPHESYCTLCGIPFWLSWEPNGHTCKGEENCFAWVNYFFARK